MVFALLIQIHLMLLLISFKISIAIKAEGIQIHLMLLLIVGDYSVKNRPPGFKYISCYY